MLIGIDHLVVLVTDLPAAVADYEAMGFTVVPGGRHPTGTDNALMAFADGAYLELIAFHRRNTAHRWWPRLEQGGGLVDFCLQTDDLPGDTETLRRTGVVMNERFPLSRLRPDGYRLSWFLSVPRERQGVAPFLIADETPREERVPTATSHANGVTGIALVTMAVEDVAEVRRWYEALLGVPGDAVEDRALGAAGVTFRVGLQRFAFLAPEMSQSPLRALLAERGPAPYAVTFAHRAGIPPPSFGRSWGARLSAIASPDP